MQHNIGVWEPECPCALCQRCQRSMRHGCSLPVKPLMELIVTEEENAGQLILKDL